MYQKTELNGIYRDSSSGAFVNTDTEALRGYQRRKKANQEIQSMSKRLAEMEEELDKIHDILSTIIKNGTEVSE